MLDLKEIHLLTDKYQLSLNGHKQDTLRQYLYIFVYESNVSAH